MTINGSKHDDVSHTAGSGKRKKVVRTVMIILVVLVFLIFSAVMALLLSNMAVCNYSRPFIADRSSVKGAPVAIVLGCYVDPEGNLSAMLMDRLKTGVDLYKAGKVRKLLLTGDHGLKDYDEVNNMRLAAEKWGVPTQDIFMDHAGFSTYESMYRARDVFQVRSAIIVTQGFHLQRSVYIARHMGLDASGISADRRPYCDMALNDGRESLARLKAFIMVNITRPKPTFLGPVIPITGDGRATHDRLSGEKS